jgi:hypothetical protein
LDPGKFLSFDGIYLIFILDTSFKYGNSFDPIFISQGNLADIGEFILWFVYVLVY